MKKYFLSGIGLFVFGANFNALAQSEGGLAQTPLFISKSYPPLNMLVMGRDHKLYYEAYNDAADLDGDGVLDVGYKPSKLDYFGYFHNKVCYQHDGEVFVPVSGGHGEKGKQCSNAWSGDFLNYLATSRMDAIRKVLYGGYRVYDGLDKTVLQASYIPQDSHSWGKAYEPERDDYDISKYAPLPAPSAGRRHLFAVTSMEQGGVPELRVIKNTDFLLWNWVSKEAPIARVTCNHPTETRSNGWPKVVDCGAIDRYKLKVEVCDSDNADLRDDESCKAYPNNEDVIYKPIGLLHDFGENEKMYFGLLTGSYHKNTAGGVLRRNVTNFSKEVNPNTGQFLSGVDGIVKNINQLHVTGFIYSANPDSAGGQYRDCGWKLDGPITQVGPNFQTWYCSMWGNPVAEMMFEALRYFAGGNAGHSKYLYTHAGSKDKEIGFPEPEKWVSPYKPKSANGAGYKHCARPVMTVLSDVNTSYDYKIPGSRYESIEHQAPGLSGFNVSNEVDAIGAQEGIHGKRYFIGQSTATNGDSAPTPKQINQLSWARGLSPEEPTKEGTYYSAGVSRYGASHKIAGNENGMNEVMTYSVAIASPLPEIRFPVGSGRFVTISPFAKSVSNNGSLQPENEFHPTNQIVDYFVTKIANTGGVGGPDYDPSINQGRPFAQFRINFEDVEQGADHDMDAIVLYTIEQKANGKIGVKLDSEYASGGIIQYMGYVISGTTKDGIYLEVRDKDTGWSGPAYRLNTPAGKDPGYCSATVMPPDCKGLPWNASREFTPSVSVSAASFLKDPLWYAAKYGMPGRNPESVVGDPDNYFLVTNAGTLKEQMTRAFNAILQTTNSVTAVSVQSSVPSAPGQVGDAHVYRTHFDVEGWAGDLIKEKLVRNAGQDQRAQVWSAANKLAQRATPRRIFFAGKNGAGQLELRPFTWSELSSPGHSHWLSALNRNEAGLDDGKAQQRVGFLRGENHVFRERKRLSDGSVNILGDIVNSSALRVKGAAYVSGRADQLNPGYTAFADAQRSQPEMVYVGANDGMLHAFDADSGEEVFAYVPSAVRENLPILTSPSYGKPEGTAHRYFVDGKPFSTDVYFDGGWKKVLIGTLGAGGRQIFALDITDRNNPKLLWEFGSAQDNNMGFMAEPVIARLNDTAANKGLWVALVPAGYQGNGSTQGRAAFFVLNMQTGAVIREFTLNGAQGMTTAQLASYLPIGNGLSRLSAVDGNADGKVDIAYAGDLLGNVWRFDLRSGDSNEWRSDLFYVAKDVNSLRQPITAAPYIIDHPSGYGDVVVVGTGRYLTLQDKENGQRQTIYGIWDRYALKGPAGVMPSPLPTATKNRASLQQQVFGAVSSVQGGFKLSGNDVEWLQGSLHVSPDDSQVNKWGWYVDLPQDGERVVYDMTLYGRGLFVTTIRNEEDPCKPGLSGRLIALDPGTGGETDYLVFDVNGDGVIDNNDQVNGEALSAIETGSPGQQAIQSEHAYDPAGGRVLIASGVQSGRQSWRKQPPNVAAPTTP